MSSSINLKPEFPSSYMYLAVILSKLGDVENSRAAYNKALSLKSDYLFELNYAATLYNFDLLEESLAHFRRFEELFRDQPNNAPVEPDVLTQREALARAHGIDIELRDCRSSSVVSVNESTAGVPLALCCPVTASSPSPSITSTDSAENFGKFGKLEIPKILGFGAIFHWTGGKDLPANQKSQAKRREQRVVGRLALSARAASILKPASTPTPTAAC